MTVYAWVSGNDTLFVVQGQRWEVGAYWALYKLGLIAKESGRAQESKKLMEQARQHGQHDAGFLKILSGG